MQQMREFFEQYATAYSKGDVAAICAKYHVPVVIISDKSKQVYSSTERLQEHIQGWIDRLKTAGIEQFEVDVRQVMPLSENIYFTSVKWHCSDRSGQELMDCFCSYTVQRTELGDLSLLVCVLDDEEQKLDALINRQGNEN
ncbi:hypothetical protein P2G88_13815 [Aliiglaciecola sp. CAU 1673]|uniref:DUF6841 family protein n=1 Tax=Aliiglaciecola sp. CAU 1673 TaxID=3032595 RepID=UPI0023DAF94D|nr:hypothetical protein [Aliiglaciecola sp. CAU 1673]MDF2179330.1 hypothetical protein [Aliiglaciecola sp. CAU 1673]